MLHRNLLSQGFTLVELMVVVGIIAILATAVMASFSGGQAQARDAERQTELRQMEIAIESYRRDNRRYPEGCNGTDWSGQEGSTNACSSFCTGLQDNAYICGLMPNYINEIPVDDRAPDDSIGGYMYITNTDRSAFKLVAPVESSSTTMTPCPEYCNCGDEPIMAIWGGFDENDDPEEPAEHFACTLP